MMWIKTGLLLCICGLAVFFSADFFATVNLSQMLASIGDVQIIWLPGIVLINLMILILIAHRWQKSFTTTLSLLELVMNRLTGFAFSYITPGTQIGGEVLQVGLLTKVHGLTPKEAVKSVASERGVDFLGNLVMVLLLSLFVGELLFQQLELQLELLYLIYSLLVFLGGATLVYMWRRRAKSRSIANRHTGFNSVSVTILTLIISILFIIELWLIFAAVGVFLDPWRLLIILLAIRVAFWLPLPVPAAAGILEMAMIFAAALCAIDQNLTLIAAFLMRLRDTLLVCIGLSHGAISGGFPILVGTFRDIRTRWGNVERAHE